MTDEEGRSAFSGTIVRGLIAGIVGATVLALWFLVIDASQGQPFRTPAFLAGAVLGRDGVEMTVGAIALYTMIHYGVFVVVGVLVSWLLRQIRTAPSMLLGFVLGFLMFDVVFYTGVSVTGVNVVAELGWPEVLAGNILAGICLMGFLHLTGATPPITWWQALADHVIIREGILAGLVGAATVAVWFFLFDVIRGQPLFTPGALGSALFLGIQDMADVNTGAATVLGYSVFHVGAFALTGIIASAFVTEAEKRPPLVLAAVLLFVAFEAFFMGFLALIAEFLLGALAWWTIAIGNLLATVSMGYFLWARHPRLQEVLRENPLDRTV